MRDVVDDTAINEMTNHIASRLYPFIQNQMVIAAAKMMDGKVSPRKDAPVIN